MVGPILLNALQTQTTPENTEMCRKVLSMHRKIYEAVRLGDADAAAEAMAYHISAFGDDLSH